MSDFNRTPRGAAAARTMHDEHFDSHRGAVRVKAWDTVKTWCVVLYGNDGYKGDPDPDRQARTKTYVHTLYFGFANLLPEGRVEFGTAMENYSWAIVLHFPKAKNTKGNCKAVRLFLHDMVWESFFANLSFPQ